MAQAKTFLMRLLYRWRGMFWEL